MFEQIFSCPVIILKQERPSFPNQETDLLDYYIKVQRCQGRKIVIPFFQKYYSQTFQLEKNLTKFFQNTVNTYFINQTVNMANIKSFIFSHYIAFLKKGKKKKRNEICYYFAEWGGKSRYYTNIRTNKLCVWLISLTISDCLSFTGFLMAIYIFIQ